MSAQEMIPEIRKRSS